jgi:ABC-type lipopolysaccharide export system ATPase subunit
VRSYRTAPAWHLWNRRQRRVVDGVSLRVQRGEVVGLVGANGAGKTTTFNMVVGLLAPHAGRVLLDGADVTALPMHLRARAGVGTCRRRRRSSASSPCATTSSRCWR